MPQGLRRGLAEIANTHIHNGFRGEIDELRTIIHSHDVVVAVWPDEYEAEGVGIRVVKGEELLRASDKELARTGARLTALPCDGADEAQTIRELFGPPKYQH